MTADVSRMLAGRQVPDKVIEPTTVIAPARLPAVRGRAVPAEPDLSDKEPAAARFGI